MDVKFTATNPKAITFTLSATATLEQWIELAGRLREVAAGEPHYSPASQFVSAIEAAARMAAQAYAPPT